MSTMRMKQPKRMFKHKCGYCGEPYSNIKKDSKFCSFACSLSSLHKKPKGEAYTTQKRTLAFVKLPKSLRVKDIPGYVYQQINMREWPYRVTPTYFHARDKCMMALGFLACGRINEILRVEKAQFDFESEPEFIILTNFYVSKRKKITVEREGPITVDIPIPTNKKALLYPFTQLVTDYLDILEGEPLFQFGESRGWQIVKECTGLWPHWFRSLGFTYFASIIKNPLALAKIYGVANVNTLMRYFKGQWEEYRQVYTQSA